MFLRQLDPAATAEFYRSLSRRYNGNQNKPIVNGERSEIKPGNGVSNRLQVPHDTNSTGWDQMIL